jgi:hypothetical protein
VRHDRHYAYTQIHILQGLRELIDRERSQILSTATMEWEQNEQTNVTAAFKNQESRVEVEWSQFMEELRADFQKQVPQHCPPPPHPPDRPAYFLLRALYPIFHFTRFAFPSHPHYRTGFRHARIYSSTISKGASWQAGKDASRPRRIFSKPQRRRTKSSTRGWTKKNKPA